jgi:hypothetical protein
MIDISLAKYSADRIGKFDFALENSGGSVLLDMCSKTYTPSLATVSLFGFSLWHVATTPKVIIQVTVAYLLHSCAYNPYAVVLWIPSLPWIPYYRTIRRTSLISAFCWPKHSLFGAFRV